MDNKYTNIGRLFYFDANIPADVKEMDMRAGDGKARVIKLFWRFWWVTSD